MTTLWLDPGFGASGDMLLGVLVGLGVPVDDLAGDLAELGVEGWSLEESAVQRAGIGATRVEVRLHDDAPSAHHRSWSSIDAMLADASHLAGRVRDGARQTFRLLSEVEAGIHGVSIDEVHFHEVGAVDAIVDIVATWAALDRLGVAAVHAGPIGLGSGGTVSTAHGELPVPAPATLKLLEGLPITGLDSPSESVTPTGAALLATAVDTWGPLPSGQLITSARGAGGRNPDTHPNAITGILIETAAKASTDAAPEQTVTAVVLATNIDDATPEILGHALKRLLEAGADDAWLVPIGMKKSRPGHELRVLCSPDLASDLRHVIFAETGTLGIRSETVAKHMLPRHIETVDVHGHQIRIKVGPYSAKPEYEDLAEASRATSIAATELSATAILERQNRGAD